MIASPTAARWVVIFIVFAIALGVYILVASLNAANERVRTLERENKYTHERLKIAERYRDERWKPEPRIQLADGDSIVIESGARSYMFASSPEHVVVWARSVDEFVLWLRPRGWEPAPQDPTSLTYLVETPPDQLLGIFPLLSMTAFLFERQGGTDVHPIG